MELHNYLMGAWYLWNIVATVLAVQRGYLKFTAWDTLLTVAIYVGLVISIVTYGDAGSIQAIGFYIWWTISVMFGVSKIGERDEMDGSIGAWAIAIAVALGAIGLTMP